MIGAWCSPPCEILDVKHKMKKREKNKINIKYITKMMSSSFLKARINGVRDPQESRLLSGQQALQDLKPPCINLSLHIKIEPTRENETFMLIMRNVS